MLVFFNPKTHQVPVWGAFCRRRDCRTCGPWLADRDRELAEQFFPAEVWVTFVPTEDVTPAMRGRMRTRRHREAKRTGEPSSAVHVMTSAGMLSFSAHDPTGPLPPIDAERFSRETALVIVGQAFKGGKVTRVEWRGSWRRSERRGWIPLGRFDEEQRPDVEAAVAAAFAEHEHSDARSGHDVTEHLLETLRRHLRPVKGDDAGARRGA